MNTNDMKGDYIIADNVDPRRGRAPSGPAPAVTRHGVSVGRGPQREAALLIVLVESGRGRCAAAEGSVGLAPADLLIVPARARHDFHGTPQMVLRTLRIPDGTLAQLAWMTRLPGAGPHFSTTAGRALPVLRYHLDDATAREVELRFDDLADPLGAWPFTAMAGLMSLMDVLTPVLSWLPGDLRRGTAENPHGLPPAVVARSDRVAAIVVAMERDLRRAWKVDDLAAIARVSPSQLRRAFQRAVGIPPIAYLNQLRAERMGLLLRTTDLTVKEAALGAGWIDAAYAARRFRRHWGLGPRDYRASVRESST